MPSGTKTFLRQKSYSVSTTATTTTTSSIPSPSSAFKSVNGRSPTSPPHDRLRFAIHLQFISPSPKKLYLSKSFRVVFSSRSLDIDEKLRVSYDLPQDPKYLPLDTSKKSPNSKSLGFRRYSLDVNSFGHLPPLAPFIEDSSSSYSEERDLGYTINNEMRQFSDEELPLIAPTTSLIPNSSHENQTESRYSSTGFR